MLTMAAFYRGSMFAGWSVSSCNPVDFGLLVGGLGILYLSPSGSYPEGLSGPFLFSALLPIAGGPPGGGSGDFPKPSAETSLRAAADQLDKSMLHLQKECIAELGYISIGGNLQEIQTVIQRLQTDTATAISELLDPRGPASLMLFNSILSRAEDLEELRQVPRLLPLMVGFLEDLGFFLGWLRLVRADNPDQHHQYMDWEVRKTISWVYGQLGLPETEEGVETANNTKEVFLIAREMLLWSLEKLPECSRRDTFPSSTDPTIRDWRRYKLEKLLKCGQQLWIRLKDSDDSTSTDSMRSIMLESMEPFLGLLQQHFLLGEENSLLLEYDEAGACNSSVEALRLLLRFPQLWGTLQQYLQSDAYPHTQAVEEDPMFQQRFQQQQQKQAEAENHLHQRLCGLPLELGPTKCFQLLQEAIRENSPVAARYLLSNFRLYLQQHSTVLQRRLDSTYPDEFLGQRDQQRLDLMYWLDSLLELYLGPSDPLRQPYNPPLQPLLNQLDTVEYLWEFPQRCRVTRPPRPPRPSQPPQPFVLHIHRPLYATHRASQWPQSPVAEQSLLEWLQEWSWKTPKEKARLQNPRYPSMIQRVTNWFDSQPQVQTQIKQALCLPFYPFHPSHNFYPYGGLKTLPPAQWRPGPIWAPQFPDGPREASQEVLLKQYLQRCTPKQAPEWLELYQLKDIEPFLGWWLAMPERQPTEYPTQRLPYGPGWGYGEPIQELRAVLLLLQALTPENSVVH